MSARSCLVAVCLFALPLAVRADELEAKARAVFETHCFRCHSHKANKSKGDLMLDAKASMLKGGQTGPALTPGHPEKSLLIELIQTKDEDSRMPPSAPLPADQEKVLVEWIKAGAPWTDSGDKKHARAPGTVSPEDRQYWAYRPAKKTELPKIADAVWNSNPIDRFIRTKLDAEGIQPSPSASRETLIRRVYFDLLGLPPTPKEVDDFVRDRDAKAYEKLIDRLLDHPAYGEQMARHWLDLVRYAESDGYRQDAYRPHAWRYRDYVIRAFQQDRPYDRFVREQLAGDEMEPGNPEMLVAIGFLAHGIYEFNQRDVRTQWDGMLCEIAETAGETFLAMGFGCAKCHDHKYDPILQKDYFRFRAFFGGLMPSENVVAAKPDDIAKHAKQLAIWEAKTAELRERIASLEKKDVDNLTRSILTKFPPDIQALMAKPETQRSPLEKQLAALTHRQVVAELEGLDKKIKGATGEKLAALRKELAQFDADRPAPIAMAMTVRETGTVAAPTTMPKRKEPLDPAFPLVLAEQAPSIKVRSESTGRRLALAEWLTRPDHPLTSRVLVNRLWQQHFGRGLVGTANDFGKLGETPTHPELIDWLAVTFVEQGWSIKKMHRLMLTSQTYQQASAVRGDPVGLKKDSDNRFLWHMPTRRLQAEQIRDALLAATGKLDRTSGGPSVELSSPRRSVYLKVRRNTRDSLMETFDMPENINSTAQRNVTTTPTQALLLLNAPAMIEHAKAFADRVHRDEPRDEERRFEHAIRLAWGRSPTDDERSMAREFLQEQSAKLRSATPAPSDPHRAAWNDLCQVLLDANEFLYVD
jgi:hypothetical protein